MLILTRKKDESIVINDNIEIMVIELDDGKVKLGINAPRDIQVHRKEVYDSIIEENKAATVQPKLDADMIKEMINK